MLDECQLPQIHRPERVAFIASAILEDAIHKHVDHLKEKVQLTSQFSDDMGSIADNIRTSGNLAVTDPVARVISRIFAEYLSSAPDYFNAGIPTATSDTRKETSTIDFARILVDIFKEELIEAESPMALPRDLSGVFILFSPANCFMFLANVSALIYPKISTEIDAKLCRLLGRKYGLTEIARSSFATHSASSNLRSLQPYLRLHVQDEELKAMRDFYNYIKEPSINQAAGHLCYFTEQLFNYMQIENANGDKADSGAGAVSDPSEKYMRDSASYTLDPDAAPEVQDQQYQMVIQLAAEGVLKELEAVESDIIDLENNRSEINYKIVRDSISVAQSNISMLLSKVIIAGSGVYDFDSLKSSLSQIIPTLLKQKDALSEIQRDLLVVLMSGGLFTFEEAISLWDAEYSSKREQYLLSVSRLLKVLALIPSGGKSMDGSVNESSLLKTVTILDSPLRSVSGIGLINYDIICKKLGISNERLQYYTYPELLAALNTFLLQYDEDFYTKLLLLLGADDQKD